MVSPLAGAGGEVATSDQELPSSAETEIVGFLKINVIFFVENNIELQILNSYISFHVFLLGLAGKFSFETPGDDNF